MTYPPAQAVDETTPRRRWYEWRRVLSVVFGASTVTVLASGFLDPEAVWIQNLLWSAGFVSPVAGVSLMIVVSFVPSRADEELDERLRSVRDRAHRYAYALLSVVVVTLLLVADALATWSGWTPDAQLLRSWIPGVAMVVLATPSAVMVWTEPALRW